MESIEHLELKRLAVAWLVKLGCRIVATEVRCPIGRYRVDVAGWLDHADSTLLDAGGLQRRGSGIAARRRGASIPVLLCVWPHALEGVRAISLVRL